MTDRTQGGPERPPDLVGFPDHSGLDLSPAAEAASTWSMLVRAARLETTLLLRNGEQVLLTLVIPVVLLVVLTRSSLLSVAPGQERVDVALPSVLAVAVIATCFTSLAIATGFERRYQVLRRMAVSPMPRSVLLGGKAAATLVVLLVQVIVLAAVGLALGWQPAETSPMVLPLTLLGAIAFAALGLLMAGTLRAEATLAAANVVFVLLLVFGGVAVPLDQYPQAIQGVLTVLPSAALGEGMRNAFAGLGIGVEMTVLGAWGVLAGAAAARWFRWE
jgi:ABC-2 type transport system permease protein